LRRDALKVLRGEVSDVLIGVFEFPLEALYFGLELVDDLYLGVDIFGRLVLDAGCSCGILEGGYCLSATSVV
jgi:hypothetical protein